MMNPRTRLHTLLALLLTLSPWFALGCDDSSVEANQLPPKSTTDAQPPRDASVDIQETGSETPPPITPEHVGKLERRIFFRSPFGNLDKRHRENLLIDGDMELSAGQGQTPWVAISQSGQTSLIVGTGGECRSGLRCLKLTRTVDALLGHGIEPDDGQMKFSMWAKLPEGMSCSAVSVYLIGGMTMQIGLIGAVRPQSPKPDEHGWCSYHSLTPKKDEAVDVYVKAKGIPEGQEVIVDDAVLQFAPAGQVYQDMVVVSDAERREIRERLARLRRLRPIGRAPWTPAHHRSDMPAPPFSGQL